MDNRFKALSYRLRHEGPRRMAREKKERDIAAQDKRFEEKKRQAVHQAREAAMFGERIVLDARLLDAADKASPNLKTRTVYLGDRKIEQRYDGGVLVDETVIPLSK